MCTTFAWCRFLSVFVYLLKSFVDKCWERFLPNCTKLCAACTTVIDSTLILLLVNVFYDGVHQYSVLHLFHAAGLRHVVSVLQCSYTSLSWKYSMGQKNGLHGFGYNSAESEPIWMISGTVWAKYWELALVDFGHNPRISDCLRGSWNFFVR